MIWLINVHSGKLEKFQNNFPRYAILSHTWGEEKDEIHFGDIQKDHQLSKTGPGRIKFDGCCQQAKADGFDYVWIDTCCIDKSHHTDYSEAITSMFSWYQTAGRCYAYLADVPDKSASTFDNDFRRSRWHTRGWTLQELLAPQDLVFYSQSWTKLGEKASMTSMIEEATGIPAQFLGGFLDASVAQRMSWAAQRVTTRGEDMAYCLFGIFNVSLPIMYGEGASAAFGRLQEAILQRTPDASILAWGLDLQHDDLHPQQPPTNRYGNILAASPQDFVNCGTVVPWDNGHSGQRLDVNGGYYHLQLPLHTTKAGQTFGLLKCYSRPQQKGCIGIPLCQVEPGLETDEFMRPKGSKAIQLFDTDSSQEPSNLRIRDLSLAEDIRKFDCRYGYSIEVPASGKLAVFDVYPKDRWDTIAKGLSRTLPAQDADIESIFDERIRLFMRAIAIGHLGAMEYLYGQLDDATKASTSAAALSTAIKSSNIEALIWLLERGFNVNSQDGDGLTPLGRAASEGLISVCMLLLQRRDVIGLDIDLEGSDGRSPLVLAVISDHVEVVGLLLDEKASISNMDSGADQHALTLAARYGRVEIMRLLLDANADLEAEDVNGETPLTMAASKGHDGVLQLLIDRKANIEATGRNGSTPLAVAAYEGHVRISRLLLDHGANANARDDDGITPLHLAARKGHHHVVKLLLDNDADVDAQDRWGFSALAAAAYEGLEQTGQLLLNSKADIESSISGGRTPLIWAAANGHHRMVQLLMDNGADGAREVGGRTALEHCLYKEDLATTRVLLGKRLPEERQDIRLDRAMNIAIAKAFSEVVRLLLREGCRIFTNDQKSGFLKYAKDCAEDMGDDKAQAMNEIITMLEDAITPRERGRSWSPNAYQQSRSSSDDNGKYDDPRWKHKVARYKKSAKKTEFSFRTSTTSGLNLDAINKTAQYFVDYPLGPPYKKIFGELGERTKILRSWIEALEERTPKGQRLVGAERDFLAEQIERVAASLYPFLQSPPRDPHSRSPLADLRRSFGSAEPPVRQPQQQQLPVVPVVEDSVDAVAGAPAAAADAISRRQADDGIYKPKNAGIVIPTGSGTLRFACHLVASLTRVHRTTLPIQIVYAGDEDLSEEDRDTIVQAAATGDDGHIEFLDITTVFNDTTLRLAEGGWAIKPFAALGSRFEEVILLDADVVFMQAPEQLLQQRSYREKGALLFHDRLLWKGQFPERHDWYHDMIKRPSEELSKSRVWTERYAEEGDSGIVVLNKGRLDVLMGLLHIGWQNTYAVRNSWTYRITYGDKETYWIGLEVTGSKYSFSRHYGGMVGWRFPIRGVQTDMTQVCSFVIAHVDEVDNLLWYNGGLLKNKMGNATEFEVPTHWMIDQQWVKGAKKKDMSCMVGTNVRELLDHEKNILGKSIEAAQDVDVSLELV
ncbi:Vegetative incompatibility protein HET-E-1 [Colletotrichum siamense]|nr:Vegetative incompatibility protein HET-E-1 [Colletotrichum siamense]